MQKTVLIFLTVALMSLTTMAQGESTERGLKPCPCNRFRIISNLEMVKAGDSVEFEIESADPVVADAEFNWTSSAGTIISGQGTRKIVVQTSPEMLKTPIPTPTPLPPAETGAYIITGSIGPRRRSFKVSANLTGPECQCPPVEHSIRVGNTSVETNKPAEVTELALSSYSLTLPCQPGTSPAPGVTESPSMVIDIATTAIDVENDPLVYAYTISGGRIIGSGRSVKWDLSGVYPGTYTITAGADDGCGICGKTQTRTVTVVACEPICVLCQCATVEVNGPLGDKIGTGENVFVANVTPGSYDPTYEWAVEGGEIVAGQGTPSISVKFDQKTLNSKASVKLRIGGSDQACACLAGQEVEYINGRRKP